jgi:hypothetical protein
MPRVSVDAATTWPTHHCSRCGFTHGPFPDDNEATEGLRVINAHAAWCPAKDKKATPDTDRYPVEQSGLESEFVERDRVPKKIRSCGCFVTDKEYTECVGESCYAEKRQETSNHA